MPNTYLTFLFMPKRYDCSYNQIDESSREKATTNTQYKTNRFNPSTIFTAPRLVILVAGPVIMKAAALPKLIPSESVALEVGQHQAGIVVGEVRVHIVFGKVLATCDRQGHRPVLVHGVHVGKGGKAVAGGNLLVQAVLAREPP